MLTGDGLLLLALFLVWWVALTVVAYRRFTGWRLFAGAAAATPAGLALGSITLLVVDLVRR